MYLCLGVLSIHAFVSAARPLFTRGGVALRVLFSSILAAKKLSLFGVMVRYARGWRRALARTLRQECFRRRRSLVVDDACFLSGAINARAEPPSQPAAS